MFPFCPHCGDSIGWQKVEGQVVSCKHCGKQVGVVAPAEKMEVVDEAEELIRRGVVARCPLCQQLVEVRAKGTANTFVPHAAATPQRKLCSNSGKQVETAPPATPPPSGRTPAGKDLRAFLTRDLIRVVSCQRASDPRIEALTLEYLDQADRVCIQVEALRDILGPDFRMRDYPPPLKGPHLAVWGNATACVIAKKHGQGGYQPMTDADIKQVVDDLRQHRQMFLP